MSVRNLDVLFRPRSIALVGASKEPRSIGAVLATTSSAQVFDGPIMPVNPHEVAIEGVLSYPSIDKLPLVPDLAVVATPPGTVPQIVADLGGAPATSAGEDSMRLLSDRATSSGRPRGVYWVIYLRRSDPPGRGAKADASPSASCP